VKLAAHTISGQQAGPHLLITGGVHGDEFEPMVAIRRLMTLSELQAIRGRLTLVPVVNEAALARGSRVAEDGLDLARACPGRADGSVTERTAHALAELIRAADYYIDLHTGGLALSIWPLVGYMLHPRADVLAKQRAMARAFNLPVVWGTDPSLEGRSLSVARDANVPAIYAEYLGGGCLSEAGVQAYVAGCLNVMGSLGMLDRVPPASDVEFEIEDPRPNSGHLQRHHPSPGDGCFEPAVKLGQLVAAGDLVGRLVDPLGRGPRDIRAEQAGRVLVLRTFPAVKQGDSLAVILETHRPSPEHPR
jgi:predicted deacylase